ncbi:protein kinase [Maribrevibacterium harenarium]|uniref:Protein kinase n=1 Tax=Maribrevibacterium harenarium TaxID=2589817 RepID=A0A501WJE5_9GAMM|nr:leucine-rich repeat-containing protein kinase family protein [Maribrevibacterium harenarium]TPE45746.1 protein kinase [Maribrevibacterium harenarium]
MHTLEQLRKGELDGCRRLQLSDDLGAFPNEIYDLGDTLEVLDLSNNQLALLPDDFAERLPKLRIFFASNNRFTEVPEVLGRCEKLDMVGFKHNQIRTCSENALPKALRWLILTDNKLEALPQNFGQHTRLEKLALAGNHLTELPASFAQLENLGLLRLSANKLAQFPKQVLALPKLAWFAFSGNPFCQPHDDHLDFPMVNSADIELSEVLGQGASGVIYRGHWQQPPLCLPQDIAVKVFKGEVTSDGFPLDELDASLSVGSHANLVRPLAHIHQPDCAALVMALIPKEYSNLGQPPSLATCTRDTFTQGQSFTGEQVERFAEQMISLVEHLEAHKVSHGDLYAHNVLVNPLGHLLLGDFGAASKYGHLPAAIQQGIQKIERRALAYFIDDLMGLVR